MCMQTLLLGLHDAIFENTRANTTMPCLAIDFQSRRRSALAAWLARLLCSRAEARDPLHWTQVIDPLEPPTTIRVIAGCVAAEADTPGTSTLLIGVVGIYALKTHAIGVEAAWPGVESREVTGY